MPEDAAGIYLKIARLHFELYKLYTELAKRAPRSKPEDLPPIPRDGDAPENPRQTGERPPVMARSFLEQRGFRITNHRDVAEEYRELLPIARFIANRFEEVREFLDAFKRVQQNGAPFTLNVGDAPPLKISSISQLGHLALEAGLLAKFQYNRQRRTFFVQPSRNSYGINFLTGKWLELYVWHLASRHFDATTIAQSLFSVQVVLPSGKDFEIDALLWVGERAIWIEAKTGEFADKLQKLGEVRKQLGIPQEDALLVSTLPLNERSRKAREKASGLRIVLLPELEHELARRTAGGAGHNP